MEIMDMNKREKQEHEQFGKLSKHWGKEMARENGVEVITTPEHEQKISDNISKYAKPLFAEFLEFPDDFESIIDAALLLWNFSLCQYLNPDKEDRAESENEFIHAFGSEPFLLDPDETMNLVQAMEKHWLENFKHDLRMIFDRKIFQGEQGIHFSVIAEDVSPAAGKENSDQN